MDGIPANTKASSPLLATLRTFQEASDLADAGAPVRLADVVLPLERLVQTSVMCRSSASASHRIARTEAEDTVAVSPRR